MDHDDITLELLALASMGREQGDDGARAALLEVVANSVAIEVTEVPLFPEDEKGRKGLGFLDFKEHRFYSVKLGNAKRDRLGSLSALGLAVTTATGIGPLLASGAFGNWLGTAAMVAIALALAGRAKPLVASFNLDEATTLDMAWRLSYMERGSRLVAREALIGGIAEVETIYGNAGFNHNKLTNALGKLVALDMMVDLSDGRYQLVEKIIVSGTDTLGISRA